ncbi:MAG: mandelate racemase/muconate lactonizing enzyme family protein [Nitrospinota bacterium]
MKITRIEATCHLVPNDEPLMDKPISWGFVFVRVETDAGITGYGLTGAIQQAAVREHTNAELAPLITGDDPLAHERVWHKCFYSHNPRYHTGAFSSAMSAVDIALWDIKGKHFGEPVWRLLGGSDPAVPAYITFGLGGYTRDQLAIAARSWIDQGYDKLKMVVGADRDHIDIGEDAARVRRVRDEIGEGPELMIDANYKLPFHRALELCKKVDPCDIAWFEEPVYGNDARLLANLRRQTSIPIAAGQNEGSKWRHRELMVHEAVDMAQPNVVYMGGFTEGAKVAAMAQTFNLPIANGSGWPHLNAHLQAGMDNGTRVEFHLLMWLTSNQIFIDPPQPENGTYTLPDTPGLGLEPNEDVLRDC